MWHLTLKRREDPRFTDASVQKGMTKVGGSTKTCKVLLINYTQGMETGKLVPNNINTLQ